MTAINAVPAGLPAPVSPTHAQIRKEADKGRDEATESNAAKKAETTQQHQVNLRA